MHTTTPESLWHSFRRHRGKKTTTEVGPVRRPTITDWAASYNTTYQPTYLLHVTVGWLGWYFSACGASFSTYQQLLWQSTHALTRENIIWVRVLVWIELAPCLSFLSINRECVRAVEGMASTTYCGRRGPVTAMHACMRRFAQPGASQRRLPLAVDWGTRRQLQRDCTKLLRRRPRLREKQSYYSLLHFLGLLFKRILYVAFTISYD